MTIVQLQVNVDDASALAKLTNIENIGKRLSSTPIEIKFDSPSSRKTLEALAKFENAQARLRNAKANQIEAENKAQAATDKTTKSSSAAATQNGRTAKSADGVATSNTKAATATDKLGKSAEKASGLTGLLGDSLGRIVAKQAAWQLIGNGITAVKNSFTDALSTMKKVDSELATVQKVTGATSAEMDALGESAYSTASKYGVVANEYLQNVSTFARAGYKDAAQGLGELAIKTQLVGDTDQETAAQFLLSADAAWKYHGNVEKLSLALDKANTIDNNYATSIQKIAEGLPIVANVASMAGMSMDETMAMLGTITATTQESGTKAATAARALILNILGDTTTEISDGVTATEESVNSLSQVLQKYAPDVVAAAQATGQLINPMEAIKALSQAAKDGLLTEADLMQMVSALGGKLRTNQLVALLENFDMYEEMLMDIGVAAGSADQEIGIMLDTWDAKANILKNTWTEFVSHLADTGAIKEGLDLTIGLVDALDSGFGRFVITAAAATAAIAALASGAGALAGVLGTLNATMLLNPLFLAGVGVAAVYAMSKAVEDVNGKYEKQAQKVAELKQQYDALYGNGGEYDNLKQRADELTPAEQHRLLVLEGQKSELDDQHRKEKELAAIEFKKDWNKEDRVVTDLSGNSINFGSKGAKYTADLRNGIDGLTESYQNGKVSQADYHSGLSGLVDTYKDTAETIRDLQEAGFELDDSMLEFLNSYDEAVGLLGEFSDSSDNASNATENTAEKFEEEAASVDEATAALQRYKAELESLADKEANANAMQTAYNKAMEDFKVGKVSSAYVKSFYDQFIPDDIKQQFGYSVADAMEWAMSDSNLGKIFGSGDMFGAFQDVIVENAKNGSLDGIVTLDDNGLITQISSYKALADQLHITEAAAQSLAQGLSVYMDGIFYTGEEAQTIVSQLGDTLGEGSHSLADYASALSSITGQTSVEGLLSVFEGLERAGAVNWAEKLGVSSAEEAREILISTLEQVVGGVEEAQNDISDIDISFDVDADVARAEENLANLKREKQDASAPADVPINVSGAEAAKQAFNEVRRAKANAGGSAQTTISAPGADGAASGIKAVAEAAKNIPTSKSIAVYARDNASGVLGNIRGYISSIQSKTVTITVVERRINGTTGMPITPHAKGTDNAVGGPALINDGKPINGSAAELVLDKGQAYIANDGEPTVVNLSPGAQVFTAEETQKIFSGAKKEFISAFAGGTGLGKPSGNSGVYGGSYSGGTGRYGSTASNSDEQDPLKKEVREKLDNIDKQITLAQNQNDRAKEQALQQQAAQMVKEFVQKYLDKGYSNTSDEVLDLLNRGYGYSDDLMNELVDSLEALTDATNVANKLAEKQKAVEKARQELENAKKQRTVRIYNPVTEQWEWVAKADDILKAQENLAKAEKDYQEEKLDREIDAIKNGNIGDIGDLTMSPALRELIANASDEEQKRIADILHAISGSAKGTADTTGESVFRSTDSHDVYYQFGNLKLSESEAKNMTVKELADQLRALKIT